ncbi:MAG: DUF4157 domain-containing protein [Desulfobulbaceae bacterium]|nr:DUF4157 domain-containing protein [Desulfobulbaceae bacterium]
MERLTTHSPKNRDGAVKGRRERTAFNSASPEVHGSSGIPLTHHKTSCACGGGCPQCHEGQWVQTKLKIGAPNDQYEQEADQVADQVMSAPLKHKCATCTDDDQIEEEESLVQPKVETGETLRRTPATNSETLDVPQVKISTPEGVLQPKSRGQVTPTITTNTAKAIQSLRGKGQSLSGAEQNFFEPRFGADFGDVKVHSGDQAASLARSINARAFTLRQDVFFGAGEYSPNTYSGRKLLAHELTHVVQQNKRSVLRPKRASSLSPRHAVAARKVNDAQVVQRTHVLENNPATAPPMSCEVASTSPSSPSGVSLDVTFVINGNGLTPSAIAAVENFVNNWHAAGGEDLVRVDGYASIDGPPSLNWPLSCERAESLANELMTPSSGNPGIPANHIVELFAQGETSQFSTSLPPNRRATAHIIGFSPNLPIPPVPPIPTIPPNPTIRINALGFTGDHTVTSATGGLGSAVGPVISDPVWTRGFLPLPSRMVSYNNGTAVNMFARFQVTPSMTTPIGNVRVRARSSGTVVGQATGVTINGSVIESATGTGQVNGISGGAAIPGTGVGLYLPLIDFQVSTDGGVSWINAGSVRCQMSFTQATPTPPGGRLREDALFHGGLAARLAATPVLGLRSLVRAGVNYNPSATTPVSYLTTDAVMNAFTTSSQCDSHAYLLRFLAMSFGIPADVFYFWYGAPGALWLYRRSSTGTYGPTFRCNRPAEDGAAHHPHFAFHALTTIGGTTHDPSYNLTGLPGILEHLTGATAQSNARAAFISAWIARVGYTGFVCPH